MNQSLQETSKTRLAGRQEEKLLHDFFAILKTIRIVAENNATYLNKLFDFFKLFNEIKQDSEAMVIKVISGRFFLNEKMVRLKDDHLSGAADIVSDWKVLGIGGIAFQSDITLDEMGQFFSFMAEIKPLGNNLETVVDELKSHGLNNIELLSSRDLEAEVEEIPEEVRRQFRKMARNTFLKAMTVVEDTLACVAEDKEINISKTKRVVHTIIDHITRDESSLIELTAIKDFDDYTYAHSTNVCVYALTVGVRMGLDRPRLSQLGITALFHDIGKIKLPADLIRKPDAFDENDWVQMQRHPMLGAKTILRNMKFNVNVARAARVAMEHHINRDLTGYPQLRLDQRAPNLFSKIVCIVDSFDALTSGRVYMKRKFSPDEAFRKMRYQMQIKFDPFLLKIFNDIIGVYPAGTVVLLNTDEIAVVLTNNDTEKSRPFIKIVANRDGLLDKARWLDLAQPEYQDLRIIRTVDPERYGIDLKAFILQD
ncbi:MAG: HD-GYP domain-containing protein [Candidatus Zixiibacteriota bacterium]